MMGSRDDPAYWREYARQLEQAMFSDKDVPIAVMRRLSAQQRRFFAALLRHRACSYSLLGYALWLDDAQGSQEHVAVVCHHVRKKLLPLGISVETLRGLGYRLTDASRKRVTEMLVEEKGTP